MNVKALILKRVSQKGHTGVGEIVQATGFSRSYINRFFQDLQNEGKIVLLGRANKARYFPANKGALLKAKKELTSFHSVLKNKNLAEDVVLNAIKDRTGIFLELKQNVARIVEYAFEEMLNNAIEHSKAKTIEVVMQRDSHGIRFEVIDKGVGIFRDIMRKKKLRSELEAVQDLIKGKQTTAPREHTGEGIFFTSRVGDAFIIQSSKKKLLFNNIVEDVFLHDIPSLKGTRVTFTIGLRSKRNLNKVFQEYAGDSFEFSKTEVLVKLYRINTEYISRSQARRILSGLDKFKTIILDFQNVDTVGQAFADEVFRVWKTSYPSIDIQYKNANENIVFMIQRAVAAPKA